MLPAVVHQVSVSNDLFEIHIKPGLDKRQIKPAAVIAVNHINPPQLPQQAAPRDTPAHKLHNLDFASTLETDSDNGYLAIVFAQPRSLDINVSAFTHSGIESDKCPAMDPFSSK
jgi:hypothetical protein